ncbi:hypothetical protein MAQ5080_00403 [Marinomonas aquimarina]|uniref:Pilus biogenesis CpaD protein (Pilus_cpaD) n=1 Tax=Marinomonas aquimarina TaxID=295068 RepID=A0A1A8T3E6_9GAMM|nr:hypothetical protein [Marinomonas aquimarina]SBS25907.1 hypothetical protein MAQ5080_00403 [Marinomonas aquimarina]
MSQIIKISALTALLGLSGCSVMEPVPMEERFSVQSVPYTQTLAVKGGKAHLAQSKHELAHFIQALEPQTLEKAVTMTLYSGEGVLLQGFARQQLLAAGVPTSRILSQDLSMQYDPSREADFALKVVKHKTVTKECEAHRLDNFYRAGNGCFVEAARNHSLVDPQAVTPINQNKMTN